MFNVQLPFSSANELQTNSTFNVGIPSFEVQVLDKKDVLYQISKGLLPFYQGYWKNRPSQQLMIFTLGECILLRV
jgi:hypothetical protein